MTKRKKMTLAEAPYPVSPAHFKNNVLFEIFSGPVFASAFVNLITFKNHKKLNVVAKPHCIEISNNEITVCIILYSGFEENEYFEVRDRENLYLTCFSSVIPRMFEFKKMDIKKIDKMAWFFNALSRLKNENIQKLKRIINLDVE